MNENKLRGHVLQMDSVDDGECKTEKICKEVYCNYPSYFEKWEKVRGKIVKQIEGISVVHLHTSRVKSIDSILRKIITKRHERLLNKNDPYSRIAADNFQSIITDLAGVRLIISYRGDWKGLHKELVSLFPYATDEEYSTYDTVPHKDGQVFLAQRPIVYHAKDDDLSIYLSENVETKFKERGYRSVHYVISYENVYVEIQTRTIYDEAWSDCDHRYVYKHDECPSYSALKEMSAILCEYTNNTSDFGEEMRRVFDSHSAIDCGGEKYNVTKEMKDRMDRVFERYVSVQNHFGAFLDKLLKLPTPIRCAEP